MKPKPPRSSAPSGQGGGCVSRDTDACFMSLRGALWTHRNLDADTSLYTKSAISGVSAGGTAMQSVSTKLDEAHHAQIAYTKKIEAERRRLHETERRCERIRQSIADFRKLLGGGFQRREKGHAKSAMDSRLENQLQVLMEKHNRTRNGNLALKTQVENRRREKMQQSVVNRKIERSHELLKNVLKSHLVTEHTREPLGTPRSRNHTQEHLRKPHLDFRTVQGNAVVAGEREFIAPSESGTRRVVYHVRVRRQHRAQGWTCQSSTEPP